MGQSFDVLAFDRTDFLDGAADALGAAADLEFGVVLQFPQTLSTADILAAGATHGLRVSIVTAGGAGTGMKIMAIGSKRALDQFVQGYRRNGLIIERVSTTR